MKHFGIAVPDPELSLQASLYVSQSQRLALELDRITAEHPGSPVEILRGMHLRQERGSVVGVFGPAEAGKSTLLRCILGLMPCKHGSIRVLNQLLDGVQVHQVVSAHPSVKHWDEHPIGMSLRLASGLEEVVAQWNIEIHLQQPFHRLPEPIQQKAELFRTLTEGHALVLLDEPWVTADMLPGSNACWPPVLLRACRL